MSDIYIKDPLIELLAIKLYEYDTVGEDPIFRPHGNRTCWLALDNDDRELFRAIARGKQPLPGGDHD